MEHVHESAGGRLAALWGHYGAETLILALGGAIAVGVYPMSGLLAATVPLALVLFVVASWLFMRRHDRHLCEKCMAAMPLNPAEEAARVKRRFWMAHTGSEPRFLLPYFAVIMASSFAIDYITKPVWAAMQLSMIYLVLAQSTHRRLQPWCPWCRENGGGEDAPITPEVLPLDDKLLV